MTEQERRVEVEFWQEVWERARDLVHDFAAAKGIEQHVEDLLRTLHEEES